MDGRQVLTPTQLRTGWDTQATYQREALQEMEARWARAKRFRGVSMPRRPKRWRGASKSWPLVTLRIPRGIKLPVFSKMNVAMVMLASTTGLAPTTIMYHRPPDGLIAYPGLRDFVAACQRLYGLRRQAKRKGQPGWKRGTR